jgi:preprotein translocase subunit YajC
MGELTLFVPLIIGLGVVMFLSSRRQKKAMQATVDLHESLAIGDRVHTTSGLEGTITDISQDSVDLEIAPGVITTWMKLAVRDRVPLDDDDDDDEESGATDVTTDVVEEPAKADPTSSPKTDS